MFPFHTMSLKHGKYYLCRCTSTIYYIDRDSTIAHCDFDNPIYQVEEEAYENCDFPEELERLLKHEKKVIHPNQESVEVVSIGAKEVRREVKIGADLEESMKVRLIELIR